MLREILYNDWATVYFIICLLIITLAKLINSKRFEDFILVLFNSKYLKVYAREQKLLDYFNSLLFLNFCISLSIFLVLGFSVFDSVLSPNFYLVLFFLGIIILVFFLKFLFEYFIAKVFNIEFLLEAYLFQKLSFFNYVGIAILLFDILFIYCFDLHKVSIYVALAIVLLILIKGLFDSFKSNQNLLKSNLFYFILYLCALEISPYVILYKLFMNYKG